MEHPRIILSVRHKVRLSRREKRDGILIQCEYRIHLFHQGLTVNPLCLVHLRPRDQWISADQRCHHMVDPLMVIENPLTHTLNGRGRRRRRQCKETGRGKENTGNGSTENGSTEKESTEKENTAK